MVTFEEIKEEPPKVGADYDLNKIFPNRVKIPYKPPQDVVPPPRPGDEPADEPNPVSDEESSSDDESAGGGDGDDAKIKDISAFVDEEAAKDISAAAAKALERGDPSNYMQFSLEDKEKGNEAFKAGDYDEAGKLYHGGIQMLDQLMVFGDERKERDDLLVILRTNLSAVRYKQKRYRASRELIDKVLEKPKEIKPEDLGGYAACEVQPPAPIPRAPVTKPAMVKALYRRAMANRAMKNIYDARSDLRKALKLDPDNAAVTKELAIIKRALEKRKARTNVKLKETFNERLYTDKTEEEDEHRKKREELEAAEEEKLNARMEEWEDSMSCLPFEEWDKQDKKMKEERYADCLKEAHEETSKEAQKYMKQREEDGTLARQKEEQEKRKKEAEMDEDEMNERDLKELNSWKKNMSKKQTDEDKQIIGSIEPKRLDVKKSSSETAASKSASKAASSKQSEDSKRSDLGFTWEEKDATEWCKECVEKCLLEGEGEFMSKYEDEVFHAVVKEVKDLEIKATFATSGQGGKKRHIYDFSAKVKYEISNEAELTEYGKKGHLARGTLKVSADVDTVGAGDGVQVEDDKSDSWAKMPTRQKDTGWHVVEDVIECRKSLEENMKECVLRFVEEFKNNF